MSRWRTELILGCSPSGRGTPLATIPDGLLRHVGLDIVAHLERRVEMNVNAVMQRSGIVEAVIERGGHLLVDRKRHGEDRQHLKLGLFRVPLVDVVQVDLAIPARTASKRTDFQILEGVVAHERSEGLTHDLGRNSHSPLLSGLLLPTRGSIGHSSIAANYPLHTERGASLNTGESASQNYSETRVTCVFA